MITPTSHCVTGRVRAYDVCETAADTPSVWTPRGEFKQNAVLYQWANIITRLLSSGDSKFRISGMYLEFANVTSPGDTVSPPSFNRERSTAYYDSLAGSATADYLRVPLTATQILSSGAPLTDNRLVCFARSTGLYGVHGKPFSYAANSVVYGAALVAIPELADATQDVLFSCFYYDPADQKPKLSNDQIGLEWELTFG